ncbi:MAG TPA: arsenate reductase ArsC [Methanomassiliicoccales archaeon]
MSKKTILFICTHNSARSQMAEGYVNTFLSEAYLAKSAGTKPSVVNPYAIQVMKEIGVDISASRSKNLSEFRGEEFDYVVTVCSDAEDICPFFLGKEHIHHGFKDPSALDGNEEKITAGFRESRDEIIRWIRKEFKG